MTDDLPTPYILVDAAIVGRNLTKMATYAAAHGLKLRPHAKTHKSTFLARMQIQHGAIGLTVAKPGEAKVMAEVSDDIFMAYPAVDPQRCLELAELARAKTIRVGIDSQFAADQLAAAARRTGTTIGILVDLDVGHHRTGVQNAADALSLAQYIDGAKGLRLDGLMIYPGHVTAAPGAQGPVLGDIDKTLAEVISLWKQNGLEAKIVSGGSTPSATQSNLLTHLTEIRPGTYVFNDINCVRGGSATVADCAATIIATVVSTAVPGQIVLDAGSKTLTSDRCGADPQSGHGCIVELPQATIAKLSEEHAQVDVTRCDRALKVGQRVTIIPNHICPCVNLQDHFWWNEIGQPPRAIRVDARGKVS
jgi:D-serine deaminase-like pyridoxal phosphate-dependent protein